ncbi:hypothetical protein MTP99_010207 [Tenebrio molitor]|nr:hypothetical protein MTP99_010207 [Tenebrio molitor]
MSCPKGENASRCGFLPRGSTTPEKCRDRGNPRQERSPRGFHLSIYSCSLRAARDDLFIGGCLSAVEKFRTDRLFVGFFASTETFGLNLVDRLRTILLFRSFCIGKRTIIKNAGECVS